MRAALIVIGIILLGAGIWVLFGHGSYQTTDTLLQVGSAKVTATHDEALPQWAGIAGMVIGLLLAVTGFLKKN